MKYIFPANKVSFLAISFILCVSYLILFTTEGYSDSYSQNSDPILKDYENYPVGNNKVYSRISGLINEHPELEKEKNIIVYILNGNSGFGSQLTVFMQHLYYLNEINPNIICMPHFSINNNNFKYHNEKYNNSFFVYFKKKEDVNNLNEYKIYFVEPDVIPNYPFFTGQMPPMDNEPSRTFINFFLDKYYLIKNNDAIEKINKFKSTGKVTFGVHIRSTAQKVQHDGAYLLISIKDRLLKLKEKFDETKKEYCVFVASEVNPYIDLAKTVFGDVYYFDNITRIDTEDDIISSLKQEDSQHKLGHDILTECLMLSMCDKVFISNSNIPVIISVMNPNSEMEEY
jgi:hypothetical protein